MRGIKIDLCEDPESTGSQSKCKTPAKRLSTYFTTNRRKDSARKVNAKIPAFENNRHLIVQYLKDDTSKMPFGR